MSLKKLEKTWAATVKILKNWSNNYWTNPTTTTSRCSVLKKFTCSKKKETTTTTTTSEILNTPITSSPANSATPKARNEIGLFQLQASGKSGQGSKGAFGIQSFQSTSCQRKSQEGRGKRLRLEEEELEDEERRQRLGLVKIN